MPVRKQYECVNSFNHLKVSYNKTNLLLIIEDESENVIEIILTRSDLLDLIQELEMYNELIWENEKSEGGKNG